MSGGDWNNPRVRRLKVSGGDLPGVVVLALDVQGELHRTVRAVVSAGTVLRRGGNELQEEEDAKIGGRMVGDEKE